MKLKHNDHKATHSHTLSLMWLKKKKGRFSVEIQYSEVLIENNNQNMLGSTRAEFCAKKLRGGDLKLAGSSFLYHQTFGLLWTTIIFNSFG